jgi:hypothetical protein
MNNVTARAQKVFAQARAARSPRAESAELQQRFASVPAITVPTVTLDAFRHCGAFATNAEGLHSGRSRTFHVETSGCSAAMQNPCT